MRRHLNRPLAGVRVVDLTRLLPGPFATVLLGDLGADVIKIEDPRGGDYARLYQPFIGPMGSFFAGINRNKRSVTLNLKEPEGLGLLADLIADADVLIESFRPGVMERLGFGAERLEADFPGVIVCSISGYGQTGPARLEAGHDLNYIARAGLVYGTGRDPGELVVPGFQVADIAGGALYAVSSILAALLERGRSGDDWEGVWLDISMTEGALAFMLPMISLLSAGSPVEEAARGMLNGGWACYGVYETQDGRHMALGALEAKFWLAFCEAAGFEARQTDGHRSDAVGLEVKRELAELFRTRTQAGWIDALAGVDCCCVPVRRPDELEDDPLFIDRDIFFTLDKPALGPLKQTATPLTPADRAWFRPPPHLGEHTREILGELGRTSEQIEEMAERGVVSVA
ncbi:MAG: CoA transferase [Myxococcales bacterium]|nr:CoA transferase [Myxococcales bacterium]